MQQAESQQRGFGLTEQDVFLAGYREATNAIETAYGNLLTLTAADQQQQGELAALYSLLLERSSQLELGIDQRKQDGLQAMVKVASDGLGRRLMEDIDRQIQTLITVEQGRLQRQTLRKDAAVRRLVIGLTSGGILIVATMLAASFLIFLRMVQRTSAAAASIDESASKLRQDARQQAAAARNLSGIAAHVYELLGELVDSSRYITQSARDATDRSTRAASFARAGERSLLELGTVLKEGERRESELASVSGNLSHIISSIADLAMAALSIELASKQQVTLLEEAKEVSESTAKYAMESDQRARRALAAMDALSDLSRQLMRNSKLGAEQKSPSSASSSSA